MDEFSSGVLEIHFSCYIFKNVEGNGMANNDWIGMTVKYDTIWDFWWVMWKNKVIAPNRMQNIPNKRFVDSLILYFYTIHFSVHNFYLNIFHILGMDPCFQVSQAW